MYFENELKKVSLNGMEAMLYKSIAEDCNGKKFRPSYGVKLTQNGEVVCEFLVKEYEYDFTAFYFECCLGWEHEGDMAEEGGFLDQKFSDLINNERAEEVRIYNVLRTENAQEIWDHILSADNLEWTEEQKAIANAMENLGFSPDDTMRKTVAGAIDVLKLYGVK